MTQPVTFDVNPMLKKVDMIKQVQIPFASSLALNNLAKEVRDNYRSEMKQRFRNPVPFTLNGMYIKASTKSNLYVEVGLKGSRPKATRPVPAPADSRRQAIHDTLQKALRQKGIWLRRNRYPHPVRLHETQPVWECDAVAVHRNSVQPAGFPRQRCFHTDGRPSVCGLHVSTKHERLQHLTHHATATTQAST